MKIIFISFGNYFIKEEFGDALTIGIELKNNELKFTGFEDGLIVKSTFLKHSLRESVLAGLSFLMRLLKSFVNFVV